MHKLEIDAELFDQLIESGGLRLSDGHVVIDLEKVVLVRVHRQVSTMIIDDSGEVPCLGFTETLRPYPKPVLDMEVMEFFTHDRMAPHGTQSVISRALHTANNLCFDRSEKIVHTMREFTAQVTIRDIAYVANCGKATRNVLVATLAEAGLKLRTL